MRDDPPPRPGGTSEPRRHRLGPEARAPRVRKLWTLERQSDPLLPAPLFANRLLLSCALATTILALALGLGVLGYHALAGLGWIDALLNASMILSGMGPVDQLSNDRAKIFASGYALFGGVVFITSMGVMATPILHRFMHRFHMDEESDQASNDG
jgi:hypothetical protein